MNSDWKLIGKKDPQLPQMLYPMETEMVVRKGTPSQPGAHGQP